MINYNKTSKNWLKKKTKVDDKLLEGRKKCLYTKIYKYIYTYIYKLIKNKQFLIKKANAKKQKIKLNKKN